MIAFPNCKINLGLYVTAKRNDGYHNLETVFLPLPIHDILEFVVAPEQRFTVTGLEVGGNQSNNLCIRAYQLLKQLHPELPELRIHLHKLIPMGAGLGGGSADGAFMLTMLNSFFRLGHQEAELIDMALQLGSDCPFFILNRPVFARGRGELMEPVPLSLSGYFIAMVNPGIHISTAQAFAGIRPAQPSIDLKNKIMEPVEGWKDWLGNDFETTVFPLYPAVAQIKAALYDQGAIYASMSGSGSSVFGIFREKPMLQFPETYTARTVRIK